MQRASEQGVASSHPAPGQGPPDPSKSPSPDKRLAEEASWKQGQWAVRGEGRPDLGGLLRCTLAVALLGVEPVMSSAPVREAEFGETAFAEECH